MPVNIGPRIQIEGEDTYRKQIQGIIQETKTLESEYKALTSSFDKGKQSLSENTQMHKVLSERIVAQKERIDELNHMLGVACDKFGESDVKTLKWEQAVNEATAELGRLQKELADLPSSIELVGKKMEDVGNKIKSVGDGISSFSRSLAPLSAAAGGILAGSAKSFIDFEDAFTGVRKTVDATETEYKELSGWIKDASTKMASSKTDIAGVMETAGQLGVTGVKDLEEFTKTMVMLGDTTNLSGEQAASALAHFMNITGTSYTESTRLGSAIVALGNNYATTESDITEMATRLAAAGKIAGLSETDILGLSTAMSSVGINAEAGGTAMTQTLSQIDKAFAGVGKNATEKMEKISEVAGMSVEDFSKAWKTKPIEALNAFIKGIANANGEEENAIALLDSLGMSGIRQSNMLQSLALASDMTAGAIETANSAWEQNNALQAEAEQRYGTTASQIQQTKEKITNTALEIGERLIPHINRLADAVDKGIAAWDGLDSSTKDAIVTTLGIVAASAPVIGAIGGIVSNVGGAVGVVGKLTGAIGSLTGSGAGAAAGTGLAAIAPASAIAVGAIAALSGAFITAYNTNEDFRKKTDETFKKLGDTWNGFMGRITPLWNEFCEHISPVFSATFEGVSHVLDFSTKRLEGFLNVVDGIFNGKIQQVLKGFGQILGSLVDAWALPFKTFSAFLKSTFGIDIPAIFKKAADGMKKSWDGFVESGSKHWKDFTKDISSGWKEAGKLLSDGFAATKKGFETAGQGMSQSWKDFTSSAGRLGKELTDGIQSGWDATKNAVSNAIIEVRDGFQTAVDNINSFLDSLQSQADSVVDGMQSGFSAASSLMDSAFSTVISQIQSAFSDFQNHFSGVISDAQGRVRDFSSLAGDAARDMAYSFANFCSDAGRLFSEFAGNATDSFYRIVDSLGGVGVGIWNGFMNIVNDIQRLFGDFTRNLGDSLYNIPDALDGVGVGMWNGFIGIVNDINGLMWDFIGNARNWGSDLMDNFIGGINDMWNNLTDTLSDMADTVADYIGFSEPEKGALSNFHTYAPDMMKLFAKGIKENARIVTAQIDRSLGLKEAFSLPEMPIEPAPSAYMPVGMGNTSTVSVGDTHITINAAEGQSVQEIADAVDEIISMRLKQTEAAWA